MSFHSPVSKNSGVDKSSSSKTSKNTSSSVQNSYQNIGIPQYSNRREYIMYLQRTIGNRAVEHLWKSGFLQKKLGINIPDNKYEKEADNLAEKVVSENDSALTSYQNSKNNIIAPKATDQTPLVNQITPLQRSNVDEKVNPTNIDQNYLAQIVPNDKFSTALNPQIRNKTTAPTIMRAPLFNSTFDIRHRLLNSRKFNVTEGGLRVTALGEYESSWTPEDGEREFNRCSRGDFNISLEKTGILMNDQYGSCQFPQNQITTRQWTNLPTGEYKLVIWTNNTNSFCTLSGNIMVSQHRGLSGESCTVPPPGPLQMMHLALDLVGLVPGIGVIADGANLIIYAAEGDWTNAGISVAALVPVIGGAALAMRRGRQVVRISGDVVESMGRARLVSALRRARNSGRTAEGAQEISRRRFFAQRNPVIADPTLPPGAGHTNRFGDITISSAGSETDRALALYHEQVHSFLSPRLNFLRSFRANLGMAAYERSSLLRYLEEALAETYAQLRVHGIRKLPEGIRFPIRNGYVTLRAVITEAAIGTVAVGGLNYGLYLWLNDE